MTNEIEQLLDECDRSLKQKAHKHKDPEPGPEGQESVRTRKRLGRRQG